MSSSGAYRRSCTGSAWKMWQELAEKDCHAYADGKGGIPSEAEGYSAPHYRMPRLLPCMP